MDWSLVKSQQLALLLLSENRRMEKDFSILKSCLKSKLKFVSEVKWLERLLKVFMIIGAVEEGILFLFFFFLQLRMKRQGDSESF